MMDLREFAHFDFILLPLGLSVTPCVRGEKP